MSDIKPKGGARIHAESQYLPVEHGELSGAEYQASIGNHDKAELLAASYAANVAKQRQAAKDAPGNLQKIIENGSAEFTASNRAEPDSKASQPQGYPDNGRSFETFEQMQERIAGEQVEDYSQLQAFVDQRYAEGEMREHFAPADPEPVQPEWAQTGVNSIKVASVSNDVDIQTSMEFQQQIEVLFQQDTDPAKVGRYHYRGVPNETAFYDHGNIIKTEHDSAEVTEAVTLLAKSKGWESYVTKGSEAFYSGVEKTSERLHKELDESNTVEATRMAQDENARLAGLKAAYQQYNVHGTRFYFKQQGGRSATVMAFRDKGDKLVTGLAEERVTRSMVELQVSRGAKEIEVSGHKTVRQQAWRAGTEMGIVVHGYTPTADEIASVKQERVAAYKTVAAAVASQKIADPESRNRVTESINKQLDERQKQLPTLEMYDNNAPSAQPTQQAPQRARTLSQ